MRIVITVTLLSFSLLTGCVSPKIGVIKGSELFTKSIYYSNSSMVDITNIDKINYPISSNSQLAVFDQFAVYVLDNMGHLNKKINFKLPHGCLNAFLIKNGSQNSDLIGIRTSDRVFVLNHNGEEVWHYKLQEKSQFINDFTVGDLNNDGEVEFYIATSNGLLQLNLNGEKVWEKTGWIRNVLFLNEGKDKNNYIVSHIDDSRLMFWNYEGKLLREVDPEVKFLHIELCDWPTDGHFLVSRGSAFYVIDIKGAVVFNYKLGSFFDLSDYRVFSLKGASARLFQSQENYFAVITSSSSRYDRSTLMIFTQAGNLLYKEILHQTRGLMALPLGDFKRDVLLVGDGAGKVYKYQKPNRGQIEGINGVKPGRVTNLGG